MSIIKRNRFIIALLLVLCLVGCGSTQKNTEEANMNQAPVISAKEAYDRMNSGDTVVVVDVRRSDEYEDSHIPGAILIPNETISETQPELLPDLDAEILIYCRSGNRSAKAATKLLEMGYINVSDFGGIIDWPYETESGAWK